MATGIHGRFGRGERPDPSRTSIPAPHTPHMGGNSLDALARLLATAPLPGLLLTEGQVGTCACLCVRVDGVRDVLRVVVANASRDYRAWFDLITADGSIVPLAPVADVYGALQRLRSQIITRQHGHGRFPRGMESEHYWPGSVL